MKMPSNTPPPKDSRELWKHFADTYFSLRIGLAVLAAAMPFVLYGYGKWNGLDLQPSMSRYFWAAAPDQCASFPLRTVFTGFLFAIGAGLYLYKGLTERENWLLNAAAVCAGLVAIFPERLRLEEADRDPGLAQLFATCPAVKAWAAGSAPSVLSVHYIAAVVLFLLLAAVAWFCTSKSLEYLPVGQDAARFRRRYKIIAIAMLLFPIAGLAAAYLFGYASSWIFFIEAAGVVTFAVFWFVKSRELALSRLEADPVEAVGHAQRRQAAEAQARPAP
ncbi:MAG: hypothetical protein IT518_18340 [Burkholderiales bacterium]|nr:hypothetical protein [Burkholderiales bacterium]